MSAIFNFIGSDFRQIAVEGHAYDPEKTEELLFLYRNYFCVIKIIIANFSKLSIYLVRENLHM